MTPARKQSPAKRARAAAAPVKLTRAQLDDAAVKQGLWLVQDACTGEVLVGLPQRDRARDQSGEYDDPTALNFVELVKRGRRV